MTKIELFDIDFELKKVGTNLPNSWKQCGVSKKDWDKLSTGNEIEVKSVPDSINSLVEVATVSSSKKNKGDK